MDQNIEEGVTASRPKAEYLDHKIGCGSLELSSRNQPFERMARVTGLEPAASGVTGRRSNQLSYTRVVGPRNYDAEAPLSRPDLHFFSSRMNFL